MMLSDGPKCLFEGDDIKSKDKITINENYAKQFEARKVREELRNLKGDIKHGRKHWARSSDDEESDSEEEDSDAELVTPEVGAKILETISKIKFGTASISRPDSAIFDDKDFEKGERSEKPTKPLTFTKFVSSTLLKEGADAFAKAEEEENVKSVANYESQQSALKKAFLDAAAEDSDNDLFVEAKKSEADIKKEELSFQEFLKSRAAPRSGDEMQLLERYMQADSSLSASEKFLRDYVIFEGWKEGTKMPQGDLEVQKFDEMQLVNDEKDVEEADQFEAAYNLRFEKDSQLMIEGHARKVFDSVRQKDEKRRRARLEKMARKVAEKEEHEKQLERLKKLKRKELLERLKIIQKVAGINKLSASAEKLDLDEEFDDRKHEKQMKILLGEDFEEAIEENDDTIFDVPPELVSIEAEKVDLSVKQKKKLAKIEKKKKRLLGQEDDGEAYAPIGMTDSINPSETTTMDADDCVYENREGLWYQCDGCFCGIRGGKKRYECGTCENFILCKNCFRSIRHPHQLIKRVVPATCSPPVDYVPKSTLSVHQELGLPDCDTANFTPEQKKMMDDMLEEYYSLYYEDIIGGDLPVRFKYTEVPAKDYGCSIDDILNKGDKELNQRISLKKLAPYRSDASRGFKSNRRYDHKSRHHQCKDHQEFKNEWKVKDEIQQNDWQMKNKKYKKAKDQPMTFLKSTIPDGMSQDRLAAYGFTKETK